MPGTLISSTDSYFGTLRLFFTWNLCQLGDFTAVDLARRVDTTGRHHGSTPRVDTTGRHHTTGYTMGLHHGYTMGYTMGRHHRLHHGSTPRVSPWLHHGLHHGSTPQVTPWVDTTGYTMGLSHIRPAMTNIHWWRITRNLLTTLFHCQFLLQTPLPRTCNRVLSLSNQ